jgi:hypothetical protein
MDGRGFPGTGVTHDGAHLTGVHQKAHAFQNRLPGMIGEMHVGELDLSADRGRLEGVFLIGNRYRLFENFEYPSAGHYRPAELIQHIADFLHGLEKPAHIAQERHNDPDGYQIPVEEQAADENNQALAHRIERRHCLPENRMKGVKAAAVVVILPVYPLEFPDIPPFPGEGLNHADSRQGLVEIAVHPRQFLLYTRGGVHDPVPQDENDKRQQGNHQQQDQAQTGIQDNHRADKAENHHHVHQHRIKSRHQQFFEDLHIAGHPGHQLTGFIGVEKRNRQPLDAAEQVTAKIEKDPVSHPHHDPPLGPETDKLQRRGGGYEAGHIQQHGRIPGHDPEIDGALDQDRNTD